MLKRYDELQILEECFGQEQKNEKWLSEVSFFNISKKKKILLVFIAIKKLRKWVTRRPIECGEVI